jgi:hypothetical protein
MQPTRFQSSWGFLGYGTSSHLALLRSTVGTSRAEPAAWIDWFLGTGSGPTYYGILKRWTGSAWTKAKLLVYLGGSWIPKPLKRWTGSTWVDVDVVG